MVNVNLDRVALDFLVPSVEAFLELLTLNDPLWTADQFLKDGKLPRRKRHFFGPEPDAVLRGIEPQCAGLEHGLRASRLPAENDADAREQLFQRERLDKVVIRTGIQAGCHGAALWSQCGVGIRAPLEGRHIGASPRAA